jgi:hypothetical protein
MRHAITAGLLVVALGVIAYDRWPRTQAPRVLRVHEAVLWADVGANGQIGWSLRGTSGDVAGFSCTGSGDGARCFVLISGK